MVSGDPLNFTIRGFDPAVTVTPTEQVAVPYELFAVRVYVVLEVGLTTTLPLVPKEVPTDGTMVTEVALRVW